MIAIMYICFLMAMNFLLNYSISVYEKFIVYFSMNDYSRVSILYLLVLALSNKF